MIYGFFIPIFFIMVGVNLDLSALNYFSTTAALVGVILACFLVGQIVPGLISYKVLGVKKSFALGTVLSARLGLTIATAQIALSLDIISSSINAAIVIAAIVSSIISPLLYKQLSSEGKKKYSVFILGGSKISGLVGERMKMHSIPYVVIESNQKRIEDLKFKGIEVSSGNIHDKEVVRNLGIKPNDQVIVLTGVDKFNIEIADMLRKELNISKVSTLLRNDTHQLELSKDGIQAMSVEKVLADSLEDLIFRPNTQQTLGVNFGEYMVEEIRFTNKKLSGTQIKKIPLPPSGSLVLVRRGREIYIPHGNTHLMEGDIITVIGDFHAMEKFREKFE